MIIDAHSHVGLDYYFGDSDIKEYDAFCNKLGINVGLIMPMPWPYIKGTSIICNLIWEYETKDKLNYYKLILDKERIIKESINQNPYKDVNLYYFNLIKNTNTKTDIKFIPLVHGKLDDANYLENLIQKIKPPAIKFHGFSGGFFPKDIKMDVIDVIKYYDIPIIIHTSVYKYDDGYGIDTKYWRNKCSPKNWCDFLIEYDLKGVLNHGACLDFEVMDKVNKSDNIMIGLGPDLDISNDPYKVLIDKNKFLDIGYLNLLKKLVYPDKILFDIDYNWNTTLSGTIDNDSIKRVLKTWNYTDSDKILYKNALSFYNKLKINESKIY